jgi:hypothetical protein
MAEAAIRLTNGDSDAHNPRNSSKPSAEALSPNALARAESVDSV